MSYLGKNITILDPLTLTGLRVPIRSVDSVAAAGDKILTAGDYVVIGTDDFATGSFTFTFPDPATVPGQYIIVRNAAGGPTITLATGGGTLDPAGALADKEIRHYVALGPVWYQVGGDRDPSLA